MQAATIPWMGANAGAAHHAETSRSSFFTFLSSAWQHLGRVRRSNARGVHAA